MGVVSIHEIWKGRDADGGLDDTRYTRVFRIWDRQRLQPTPPLSVPRSRQLRGTSIRGRRIRTTHEPSASELVRTTILANKGWICAATYSTKRELAKKPEDDDIEISIDEEDVDVTVVKDRDNKAVPIRR